MSKTLVFEGCPTCEIGKRRDSSFGAIAFGADAQQYAMEVLQGAAAGAGVSIATSLILPRIPFIGTMIPKNLRPVVGGLASIGIGIYLKDRNPKLASGIAIGGMTVAAVQLIQGLLGPTLGLSGLGEVEVLSTEGMSGYGQNVEVLPSNNYSGYGQNVEIESTGALIAEEMSGMGAMIVSEMSGYGDDNEDDD